MGYYLENEQVKLEFDRITGSIIGLLNKNTGWQAIRQPKLALGIRLLVPMENHRNNRVLSESQRLPSFEKKHDQEVVLKWDRVTGDKSGSLAIAVELIVTLQGSQIVFDLQIDNQSLYVVEEAWSPCIGGLREPKGEGTFDSLSMDMCGGFNRTIMGNGFPQKCGYWGTDYPTFLKTYGAPNAQEPFILVTNNQQGLYMGMHDQEENIVSFVHELKPGYIDSKHHRIPNEDEMSGLPAGYVISAVRLPFIQSGECMKLAPIVISLFEGTWHKGMEPYIQWRKQWYESRPRPAWMDEVDCWMTLHINSPEGRCFYRYNELPAIAREAKEHGVQALQLIGWARGGQDGAEPYQDTDPLLGTRDELKQAIQEIEERGIRVLLMCKFKWADQSIPEFESEIHQHTLKDMYGNSVQFPGYAYQTLAQQLFGASRRCGAGLCHSSEDFRKLALREFKKIVDLGSSGMLYDELMNDMLLCFDPAHKHRRGESNLKGSLKLAEAFYELASKINPDFLMTGESPTDRVSQYYPISYVRTWDGRWEDPIHRPALKYMNPDMKIATCLTGWDDREMVNQCIAFGYIINYEPYNFKGKTSDIPDTVAYGQKAQKLRRKLWNYLWNGKFTDTVGCHVEVTDPTMEFTYSVFENQANGKKAVVVVNHDFDKVLHAKVALNDGTQIFEVHDLENEFAEISKGTIKVQPRSLIVLVEL